MANLPHPQQVVVQAVGLAQGAHGGAVVLGQFAEGLSRPDDVGTPALGEKGARGRVLVEIAADAFKNGPRQALLVAGGTQLAFLAGVGDLHQQGGDVRRFEDHETGVLDTVPVDRVDALEGAQDLLRRPGTGFDGAGQGKVQEDGGEHVVLVGQAHPADEVGGIFRLGQPAGHFVGGPALGEDVHRGAAYLGVAEGIGVDGDEQVGARLAGLLDALAQTQVVVAVADEHGAHPRFLVHQGGEAPGDGQHHVLLARAAAPVGAGVLPSVTRVDGHHHIPRPLRPGRRPCPTRLARFLHLHHQTVPLLSVRRHGVHPIFAGTVQVEDDAQGAIPTLTATQAFRRRSGPSQTRTSDTRTGAATAKPLNHMKSREKTRNRPFIPCTPRCFSSFCGWKRRLSGTSSRKQISGHRKHRFQLSEEYRPLVGAGFEDGPSAPCVHVFDLDVEVGPRDMARSPFGPFDEQQIG